MKKLCPAVLAMSIIGCNPALAAGLMLDAVSPLPVTLAEVELPSLSNDAFDFTPFSGAILLADLPQAADHSWLIDVTAPEIDGDWAATVVVPALLPNQLTARN